MSETKDVKPTGDQQQRTSNIQGGPLSNPNRLASDPLMDRPPPAPVSPPAPVQAPSDKK